jgi:vacuole morphology and inheritance protein 14
MNYFSRRGPLVVRRLCVLLGAERVYREFSIILGNESDLDFAATMIQVSSSRAVSVWTG